MRFELSKRMGIILSLILAAVFGAVWSGLFPYGVGYGDELSVLRHDLTIEKGQVISAQGLQEGRGAEYIFPPPLYVLERIEFEAVIYNVSGSLLQINFTRDGNVLQTESVYGSEKIMLAGFEEYRLQNSMPDVKLQAKESDVIIESIYIRIGRGTKTYNPVVGAFGYTLPVAVVIVLLTYRRKMPSESINR